MKCGKQDKALSVAEGHLDIQEKTKLIQKAHVQFNVRKVHFPSWQ